MPVDRQAREANAQNLKQIRELRRRRIKLSAFVDEIFESEGHAIHDNVDGEIALIPIKAVPVAADMLIIEDSAVAGFPKRQISIGSLPSSGGGGGDPCITRAVSSDITIATGTTCLQRNPTIAAGVVVTVETGGEWYIL